MRYFVEESFSIIIINYFVMFKNLLDDLKQKASEVVANPQKAIQEATRTVSKVTLDAVKVATDVVDSCVLSSNLNFETKEKIQDKLQDISIKTIMAKEELETPKVLMEHKIIMMGGRRSGKSTILASILQSLRLTPGGICTIIDKTDYTQMVDTPQGPKPLTKLDTKQNEVKGFIKKVGTNSSFLVDMTPSYGKGSYILEVSSGTTAIDFEFVDVPGEWMRANKNEHGEHKKLEEEVASSDVFVIAIDTPFLMNPEDEDGSINAVYNRINDITQTMLHMKISEGGLDKKQIILCPVKCEKWVRHGDTRIVVEKVLHAYRDLINRWVDVPEVTIQIMPIQTVGGIESDRLLPAMRYFKDDKDRMGTSCSKDPNTGLCIDGKGRILKETSDSWVDEDKLWLIDYLDIPLSWYRLNGVGYKPVFCEQVGYHVLKFLIEKEEEVVRKKAETDNETKRNSSWLKRFLISIFKPTFGVYLPVWRDVINSLNAKGLLKLSGDGFEYVKSKVN